MKDETLSRDLSITEYKARYDECAKEILAHRSILSHIITGLLPEFEGVKPEEAVELIDPDPEVGTVDVLPGYMKPKIMGENTESLIPDEGKVTFDVRFSAWTPGGEKVKLIIDLEAQKRKPSYSLASRGIFYLGRMLSMQHGVEFTGDDYDSIKKVYSIWICMAPGRGNEESIISYAMEPRIIMGEPEGFGRYDLIGLYIIGLGKDISDLKDERNLHRFLEVIFSEKLEAKDKQEILEEEYDIIMDKDMEGRLRQMCNLSDLIEERGIERGLAQGMNQGRRDSARDIAVSLLRMGKLSYAEVAKATGLSLEEVVELAR